MWNSWTRNPGTIQSTYCDINLLGFKWFLLMQLQLSLKQSWLDQIHGFSTWTIEAEAVHDVHHSLITGLTGLCLHLCMLGQPFSMQLAVPNEMLWTVVIANRNSINETLMKCKLCLVVPTFPLEPF